MTARRHRAYGFSQVVLSIAQGIWAGFVAVLALVGLATLGVVGGVIAARQRLPLPEPRAELAQVASAFEDASRDLGVLPARREVIYLNREGGTLTPGRDDATRNVSSVVERAGLEGFEAPAFRGSAQRWDAIVSCVRGQFDDYDVEVVDQRPVAGPYVMVMVGGRPGVLAEDRTARGYSPGRRLTGLAPMGREPVPSSVVFVFSRELRERTRDVCETAAHEVGHAYGLDHAMDRDDPMSYLPRRGARSFQDDEASCGEREARACHTGAPTQNSHQHLLEVLGPHKESEPAGDARPAGPGAR